jgi:regulator of protease activity HflC (stomatin/prohibitin superfamily)
MQSLVNGLAIGSAVVAVIALVRASFRVDNGNVGVLAVFGRFARDGKGKLRTFGPGLHWRVPWAQVIHVSLAERSMSLDKENAAMEALAPDGTRIRVNARVRFRVDPEQIARFLADAKHPSEHLGGLFRLVVREQVARFEQRPEELSAYTALRLRVPELQRRMEEAMAAAALAEYGIIVTSVDILQIDPPEELVDALNAVITAESEANALVSRTELQAQQRVLSAEQVVAIANARALATEAEIRTVGGELATLADQGVLRDYVDRRRLEVLGGSRRVYMNHQPTTLRS